MMQRPFWEIRVRDPRRERWQRILILLLIIAVPLTWYATRTYERQRYERLKDVNAGAAVKLQRQSSELEQLRRKVAVLGSGEQLTQQAMEQSRQSIKLLEAEIYLLQQELGTTKGIIGANRKDELQLRAFEVVPSEDPQRFFFKLFLGRTGNGSTPMAGKLAIEVRGKQGGKAVSLPLAELSRDVEAGGIPFSLRNFLAFPEGGRLAELRLPQDFSPSDIRVKASVDGERQALEKTFKWQAE